MNQKDNKASMQVIDPALLVLIGRGLTQAIAATQGGNSPGLLHEIKTCAYSSSRNTRT